MGIHKIFNNEIYKVSDPVKFAVAQKLNKIGYYTKVVEDFNVDIKVYIPEQGYQDHEVEWRTIWKSNLFPYPTIHIPERKTRLINETDLFYWVVNNEINKALVCNAKHCMIKSYLKMIPNKQISTGEEFYDIPIGRFKYFDL